MSRVQVSLAGTTLSEGGVQVAVLCNTRSKGSSAGPLRANQTTPLLLPVGLQIVNAFNLH